MGDWLGKVRAGFLQGVAFIKEAWQELKRVYWPTRRETYAATSVVIILVLLVALYLAVVDFGLTRVIQSLLS